MVWTFVFLSLFCGSIYTSDWVYRLEPVESVPRASYQTPEHWKVLKPGAFQKALWHIPGEDTRSAWVALSILDGGGTLEDNLSRWLRQMKLDDALRNQIVQELFERYALELDRHLVLGFDLTALCRERGCEPVVGTYVIVYCQGTQKTFYKLWGDVDIVARECEYFKSWVQTELKITSSQDNFFEVSS